MIFKEMFYALLISFKMYGLGDFLKIILLFMFPASVCGFVIAIIYTKIENDKVLNIAYICLHIAFVILFFIGFKNIIYTGFLDNVSNFNHSSFIVQECDKYVISHKDSLDLDELDNIDKASYCIYHKDFPNDIYMLSKNEYLVTKEYIKNHFK